MDFAPASERRQGAHWQRLGDGVDLDLGGVYCVVGEGFAIAASMPGGANLCFACVGAAAGLKITLEELKRAGLAPEQFLGVRQKYADVMKGKGGWVELGEYLRTAVATKAELLKYCGTFNDCSTACRYLGEFFLKAKPVAKGSPFGRLHAFFTDLKEKTTATVLALYSIVTRYRNVLSDAYQAVEKESGVFEKQAAGLWAEAVKAYPLLDALTSGYSGRVMDHKAATIDYMNMADRLSRIDRRARKKAMAQSDLAEVG
jgi:hypothetical protein